MIVRCLWVRSRGVIYKLDCWGGRGVFWVRVSLGEKGCRGLVVYLLFVGISFSYFISNLRFYRFFSILHLNDMWNESLVHCFVQDGSELRVF